MTATIAITFASDPVGGSTGGVQGGVVHGGWSGLMTWSPTFCGSADSSREPLSVRVAT